MIRDAETLDNARLRPEPDPVHIPTGPEFLAALEELGILGMWEDRKDIDDALEFAEELRRLSETRNRG